MAAETQDEPTALSRHQRRHLLTVASKKRAVDFRKLDDSAAMEVFHLMQRLQREGGAKAARKLRRAGDALCAEMIGRGLLDNVGGVRHLG